MENQSRENPVFGRKVFFINPPFLIQNQILPKLKLLEYEVYVIPNYRKAKSVLSRYPDSMAFIDLDTELKFGEWFNLIKLYNNYPALETIYIGAISKEADSIVKDKFMMNLRLQCGFIDVNQPPPILLDSIIKILDLNGAKGRRQYIRLNTVDNKRVNAYFMTQQKMFSIDVNDISSVGLAITYNEKFSNFFQANTLINNVGLTIENETFVCSCVVLHTLKKDGGKCLSVLMFTKQNKPDLADYIRQYVFSSLEGKMKTVINACEADGSIYSDTSEYDKLKIVNNSYGTLESL